MEKRFNYRCLLQWLEVPLECLEKNQRLTSHDPTAGKAYAPRDTKKGTRYAPGAYYMMGTYAPGAYRIGGTRTRGDEVG